MSYEREKFCYTSRSLNEKRSTDQLRKKSKQVELQSYLHNEALHQPIISIGRHLSRAILKLVSARGLEKRFSELFSELRKEVHNNFLKVNQDIGVNTTVITVARNTETSVLQPYKFLGKTSFQKWFLFHKKVFESQLFITYPLIRKIHKLCVLELPECLIDFSEYRPKVHTLWDIQQYFDHEISKADKTLNRWYNNILNIVHLDKTSLPKNLEIRYLGAGTGLMSVYVSRSIQASFDYFIDAIQNRKLAPYLHMTLYCKNGIYLEPSQEQILDVHQDFVSRLLSLADRFISLQSFKSQSSSIQMIPSFISSKIRDEYQKKVKCTIRNIFEQIENYSEMLNKEFASILVDNCRESELLKDGISKKTKSLDEVAEDDKERHFLGVKQLITNSPQKVQDSSTEHSQTITPKDSISDKKSTSDIIDKHVTMDAFTKFRSSSFINSCNEHKPDDDQNVVELFVSKNFPKATVFENEITFDEGYAKIIMYRKILSKLNYMVDTEHFITGQISQSTCRIMLLEIVSAKSNEISRNLVLQHLWINEDICETFQIMFERPQIMPQTTDELIDLGNFMALASNELLPKLKEQVETSVLMVIRLLDVTALSNEHIQLTACAVNWNEKIESFLETSMSMLEAWRFDFEEYLQKAIKDLQTEAKEFISRIEILDEMNDADFSNEYLTSLSALLVKIREFDKAQTWINNEELLFKYPPTDFPEIKQYKHHVFPFHRLNEICASWKRSYNAWMDGPLEFVDFVIAEKSVATYLKELYSTERCYRSSIKHAKSENYTIQFKGVLDDPDPYKHPSPMQLCAKVIKQIKLFEPHLNIMRIMCSDALLQRHWDEMSEIAGYDMTPNARITLRKLISMGFENNLSKYEIISTGAVKEKELLKSLLQMKEEWIQIEFKTTTHSETRASILEKFDEIQAILDEQIIKTLTLKGSVFSKPYEHDIKNWYNQINRINSTLEEYGKVQNLWLHMLPIFSSSDIFEQMPKETDTFREVDSVYRKYIRLMQEKPVVIETASSNKILEDMIWCRENLEYVNEGVSSYLDRKRLYFPRFFFLSNKEIIEVLSQSENFSNIEYYLRKCFQGIFTLKFNDSSIITAMVSEQLEEVEFLSSIELKNINLGVERWFALVETQMKVSIREKLVRSLKCFGTIKRLDWLRLWPEQIVILVSQINWVLCIEQALEASERTSVFLENVNNVLDAEIKLIKNNTLLKLDRHKVSNLILMDIHIKDVFKQLLENDVRNRLEFSWLIQMRYYFEEDCKILMLNASSEYSYEYLGNSERLVITPITNRCFRSLFLTKYLRMYGLIHGSTEAGKTETFKELASALGTFCTVFNSYNPLNYKVIGKLLKGIASSGTWICFEDFSKLHCEVLSVVAQQMNCVISALQTNCKTFQFEEMELTLNSSSFVCITISPTQCVKANLPDNLRAIFRIVTMTTPDYHAVSEIILYSNGFENAKQLAVKLVTFYRISSEQFSFQDHYNNGIRTLKEVLKACSKYKRDLSEEHEDKILLKCLREICTPPLVDCDLPIFEHILSDLFQTITISSPDCSTFTELAKQICSLKHLQPTNEFFRKLIQTHEMLMKCSGVMLIGQPFSGKTSILNLLLSIYEVTELKVYVQYIFPKALTISQLYGRFDVESNEWYDGVATTFLRQRKTDETYKYRWLIFDGPVDSGWIEIMNTVLDDNKKLCLLSGECINISTEVRVIFEVMDAAHCSPAMVSRCGIVHMEPETIGWQSLIRSWLANEVNEWKRHNDPLLQNVLEWMIPPIVEFIKNCNEVCSIQCMSLALNVVKLVDMILGEAFKDDVKKDDDPKILIGWIQASLIFAGVWGMGGILTKDSREKFDEFYKNLWKGQNEKHPYPSKMEKLEIAIPLEGLVFDYTYIYKARGMWKNWFDIAKDIKVIKTVNIQDLVVPTMETLKYEYLVKMHIKNNIPVLVIGPTGTGKSLNINNLVTNKLNQEHYQPVTITFMVKLTANQTQKLLLDKLTKIKRGHYGSPDGKKCIILIDDLNLPEKDDHDVQTSIELLRQYLEHKSWYNLEDGSYVFLHNLVLTGVMGLASGNKQELCSRFLRHFSVYAINEISDDNLARIFSNVLLLELRNNGFPNDVVQFVQQIVDATLDVYHGCVVKLKSTPSKGHYLFNIKDIARIVFGCAMLRKESSDNKKIFPRIWVHEVLRTLYDRLINRDDRCWLYNKIKVAVTCFFKEEFNKVFESLEPEGIEITETSLHKLIFGKYFDIHSDLNDRKYLEVSNIKSLRDMFEKFLHEYNSNHINQLNLVLFENALEHVSKLCRILIMPCSNAVLLGMTNTGRKSLTKLASAVIGLSIFVPSPAKDYNFNNWRFDLKTVVKEAGSSGKHTILLVTEAQIKEEQYLQDINNLMKTGDIPDLFSVVETQEILEMTRLDAQGGKRNVDIGALAVFSFFTRRIHETLHTILSLTTNRTLRMCLSRYPSVISDCTIVWFEAWPTDALSSVAHAHLKNTDLPHDVQSSLVQGFIYLHKNSENICEEYYKKTAKRVYVTTTSFIDLITTFRNLITLRQKEMTSQKDKFIIGINKLDSAGFHISNMETSLKSLKERHKQMGRKAMSMLQQVEKETVEVEKASLLVKKDEEKANLQAAEAEALKAECEADLAEAIPILEDAISALNTLKPTDITLVKSMKNPPDAIKLVMAAVCVIKDVKPDKLIDPSTGRKSIDFWGPSKRILGDIAFLQSLKDFDKDHIKPEIMVKIRKEYIPHKDFNPRVVAKASSAAEGLCKWIIAMDMYDKVAKEVAPKKEKLEKAERMYASTMAILLEKKGQVNKLEEKIANLNILLQEANSKKLRLEIRVRLCSKKLDQAKEVINNLIPEKSRWSKMANILHQHSTTLAGDLGISCGFISYLSAFSSTWRQKVVENWIKYIQDLHIPVSSSYNFVSHLGLHIQIQSWYRAGLPKDSFSTENAIIQEFSKRWSLIIDPQQVASAWIRQMEKPNGLTAIRCSDSDYIGILEKCIETGKPLLIESSVDSLDLPSDFKLDKNVSATTVALAGKFISVNPNFRLYLTCSLKDPDFSLEIWSRVTIITFCLSFNGVCDQLLETICHREQSNQLVQDETTLTQYIENTQTLNAIEKSILNTLSGIERDILEDQTAIDAVKKSALSFLDISKKQVLLEQKIQKSEETRNCYRSIAQYSAVLYSVVSDLSNLNFMYQYSLKWFIRMYIVTIDRTIRFPNLDDTIKALKKSITYNIYSNVCYSLYEEHKITFSFLLAIRIKMHQQLISKKEVAFFYSTCVTENPLRNPDPEWINCNSWNELWRLEEIPSFKGFCSSFIQNIKEWKTFFNFPEVIKCSLPNDWSKKLTYFQVLLIVRTLSCDNLLMCIHHYVAKELGKEFATPPFVEIRELFYHSISTNPIIFVLSEDLDPGITISKFAALKNFSTKLRWVSLGKERCDIAENLVKYGQKEGLWICLENCHIVESWMPILEELCRNIDSSNTDLQFRLWLTTNPFKKFPVSILQNSLKIMNDPPMGLKQNLLSFYSREPLNDPSISRNCPGNEIIFSRLLYGLAFFHVLVQERKRFGTLGWNNLYVFNNLDFTKCVEQLQIFINTCNSDSFDAMYYIIGEYFYGGQIEDAFDLQLLRILLSDLININVINKKPHVSSNKEYLCSFPSSIEYHKYITNIKVLENFDEPGIFGLHYNAGFVKNLKFSHNIFQSLAVVEEHEVFYENELSEELEILVCDIIKKLPNSFNMNIVKSKFPLEYLKPTNAFLHQELEHFNKLLGLIRNSLQAVCDSINGASVMTSDLETFCNTLLLKKIPVLWEKLSYPTQRNLSGFIIDFINRLEFLHKWYENGEPSSFWISSFFFTQRFFTSILLHYARKNSIPISKLRMDYKVINKIKYEKSPSDGVFIYGLFIEGASWSSEQGILKELPPKMFYDSMPPIHLQPIISINCSETNCCYTCPLYKTAGRLSVSKAERSTNFVCCIPLKTDVNPRHWAKRSVVLLCEYESSNLLL